LPHPTRELPLGQATVIRGINDLRAVESIDCRDLVSVKADNFFPYHINMATYDSASEFNSTLAAVTKIEAARVSLTVRETTHAF
jgi:hypothetical protein